MATNGKKSRKKIIIFSALGVVLLAVALMVLIGSKKEVVLTVQTEKASRRTITQIVTATGKIQPEISVKIMPEVGGEIVALPVKEGDRVKKGDILLKIKPDFYMAERDQSVAMLMSAQAGLSKAEPEYKRIKSLYEKGLVSQSEYDQARAGFESAKASYAQAKAAVNQAEENLRKTTIMSPMDGTISQLNSRLGERVIGAQFQGTDVMTVADLSRMEARVDVSETDVVMVSVGDTARIAIDALPDRKANAVVYEIANTGTSKGLGTQEEVTNFQVKMRVVDKGINIRPGMSMTADIETETKHDVLTVPIQSVTTRAQKMEMKPPEGGGPPAQPASTTASAKQRMENKPKEIVFVVESGQAKAYPVKRGISNESYVEITEGLKDSVMVVSGSYKAINRELEDGSKVRVEEAKKPGEKPKGEGA